MVPSAQVNAHDLPAAVCFACGYSRLANYTGARDLAHDCARVIEDKLTSLVDALRRKLVATADEFRDLLCVLEVALAEGETPAHIVRQYLVQPYWRGTDSTVRQAVWAGMSDEQRAALMDTVHLARWHALPWNLNELAVTDEWRGRMLTSAQATDIVALFAAGHRPLPVGGQVWVASLVLDYWLLARVDATHTTPWHPSVLHLLTLHREPPRHSVTFISHVAAMREYARSLPADWHLAAL